jgi:hypothetical protein
VTRGVGSVRGQAVQNAGMWDLTPPAASNSESTAGCSGNSVARFSQDRINTPSIGPGTPLRR